MPRKGASSTTRDLLGSLTQPVQIHVPSPFQKSTLVRSKNKRGCPDQKIEERFSATIVMLPSKKRNKKTSSSGMGGNTGRPCLIPRREDLCVFLPTVQQKCSAFLVWHPTWARSRPRRRPKHTKSGWIQGCHQIMGFTLEIKPG